VIVTDDRVALFISEKVGKSFFPPFTCMGLEKDGEIVSGVLLNCFEKPDLHVSVAGSWFPRSFLREVGRYVFEQLGFERATIITEQPKVVRLAERLGGEVEGMLRNHFGHGRSAFVVGILKEDYRF
jgi:RimJ/RimL family protein N-acetyltransferase